MPRNDRMAVDANVILRHLLRDQADLVTKADVILAPVMRGEGEIVCDPVTLSEVVYVLKGVYHWLPKDVMLRLLPIVRQPGFLMPDKARYLLALKLMGGPAPHFGDACCCAAALSECGGRLYSFDRALSRVPEIDRREAPPGSEERL